MFTSSCGPVHTCRMTRLLLFCGGRFLISMMSSSDWHVPTPSYLSATMRYATPTSITTSPHQSLRCCLFFPATFGRTLKIPARVGSDQRFWIVLIFPPPMKRINIKVLHLYKSPYACGPSWRLTELLSKMFVDRFHFQNKPMWSCIHDQGVNPDNSNWIWFHQVWSLSLKSSHTPSREMHMRYGMLWWWGIYFCSQCTSS